MKNTVNGHLELEKEKGIGEYLEFDNPSEQIPHKIDDLGAKSERERE